MKQYIKSNWWISVAIVCVFLYLMFTMFRGCYNPPKTEQLEKPSVDSTAALRWADSVKTLKQKLDTSIDRGNKAEKALVTANNKVGELNQLYRKARADKDTVRIIDAADSLSFAVEVLRDSVNIYRNAMEEQEADYSAALSASDSAAIKYVNLASDWRVQANLAVDKYNKLAKDKDASDRKVKAARTQSRILAAIAAIAAGVAIAK